MKSGNTVNVWSNQYKLNLGSKAIVYQYKLEIIGMKIWDASLVHRILRSKKAAIDTALGLNTCSGASIYVPSEITEDVKFNVTFEKVAYTISIESATRSIVNLDDHFKNADNTTSQNLINIVIK